MGPKKEKGKSSALDDSDHWAFLEEIEAPMWVDLTMETRLDEETDAWFRLSHQVHQMSSQQLKKSIRRFGREKNVLPNLGCKSPRVPDSVSRSRGKDYTSRKWLGKMHDTLTIKHHPVWKLDGVSVSEERKKAAGKTSSVSTVTLDSFAKTEESSSSSIISKCQNLRPDLSVGGPRKISNKKRTSHFARKIYREIQISGPRGSKNARFSIRKTGKGKSSVGSSCTVESILENGNSAKIQRGKMVKGIKVASVSVDKLSETETKNTTQQRAGGTKIVCQETKPKVLGLTAPRKPLAQLNGSRPLGDMVVTKPRKASGAVKKQLKSDWDKENTIEEKLQYPKYVSGSTAPRKKPLEQINGSRQGNMVVTKPRTVADAVKKHLISDSNKGNANEEKLKFRKYVKPVEHSKKWK